MIFNNIFSRLATPVSGKSRVRSSDGGAASIVFLMMALVFLPVAGIHLAMLLAEAGATANIGHMASMVQTALAGALGLN